MPRMKPYLSVLPDAQQRLLPELKDTPSHFVLCGGTAIALRLGHRISIDFDFFSHQNFEADALYQAIPYLKDSEIIQEDNNTLSCLVQRQGTVKVSFFGGLAFDYIKEPEITEDVGMQVASLVDLAGMKMAVIQKRAEAKDYIDIDALIAHGHIDLVSALAAGALLYGSAFNPQIALKALVYFEDGDLKTIAQDVKQRLRQAVHNITPEAIPQRMLELQGHA